MAHPLPPADAAALRTAFARVQAGDPAAALPTLATLAKRHRRDADVHYVHGLALRDTGQREAAVGAMRAAVAAAPLRSDLLLGLGNLLAAMERSTEAIDAFDRAIARDPAALEPRLNKAVTQTDAGDAAGALATLDDAPPALARHPRLLAVRGTALKALDRLDEALAALEAALAGEPHRALTHYNYGVTLRAAGRFAAAEAAYRTAHARGIRTPALASAWAAVALEQGKLDEAQALYQQVVAHAPDDVEAQSALVRLAWEYGGAGAAAFDGWAAAVRARSTPAAAASLAGALASHGLHERALAVADSALAADPRDTRLLAIRASALATCDPDHATGAFETLIAAEPDSAGAHAAFAHHLLRRHDFARAEREAEHATVLDPLDQSGWAYLGTAWAATADAREHWLHDYERFVAPIALRSPIARESTDAFVRRMADATLRHHHTRHHPGAQSLRQGSQTSGDIFRRADPDLADLKLALEQAVTRYVATLPTDAGHPFLRRRAAGIRFSGAWSARLFPGGFHVSHIHPQGWISSASYWIVPSAVDDQAQPRAGWIEFGVPPSELGLAIAPRRSIRPEPGMLVLFPSSMWHGTVPFDDAGPRLSVAFDVVPTAI